MVKKIGSILLFICTVALYASDVSVHLDVLDMGGTRLEKAQVGQPFRMHVTIEGKFDRVGSLNIRGIDPFTIESRATARHTNVINGIASIKTVFQYVLLAKNEGPFTLGPAVVSVDGADYSSNSVSIPVVLQADTEQQAGDPRLVLDVNKQQVVVGEKVTVSVRFYPTQQAKLIQIEQPKYENIFPLRVTDPISSSDESGVYAEWKAEFTPLKTGRMVVPAARAWYSVKRKHSLGSFFEAFSDVLQLNSVQKEIYSNAASLDVAPLPSYTEKVDGVGQFYALHGSINQNKSRVGEGLVYKLTVKGDNLIPIEHPTLSLPDIVAWYESKKTINPSLDEKTFEYIVQANKDGLITLPAQAFVFFDTKTRSYKTLHTKPITLTIEPGVLPQTEDAVEEEEVLSFDNDSDLTVLQRGAWCDLEEFSMSWWWFFVICFVTFVGFIIALLRSLVMEVHSHFARWLRYKTAFYSANKNIDLYEKNSDSVKLFDVFDALCNDRDESISSIYAILKNNHSQASLAHEWQDFYTVLQKQKFYDQTMTAKKRANISKQAKKWIMLLRKYI